MTEQVRNVFVSHVHDDDEGLARLKDLLGRSGMQIRDYSIRDENPNNAQSEEYIKAKILAPRIRAAGVLVVYVSSKTCDCPYVEWEVQYAKKQGKRIVAVWAHGEKGCDLPPPVAEHAHAIVGWNGNNIFDAINGDLNDWEQPDGSRLSLRTEPRSASG